MDITIL